MDLDDLAEELEDKLNLLVQQKNGGGQHRFEDEDSWLFVPEEGSENKKEGEGPKKEGQGKTAEEQQNLEKWLRGAVEKVDFRTRSALSRRLEKKKRKADKERRLRNNNGKTESNLSMIEEVSSESGPMSDREQRMRPREKENMAARKAISEASVCSEDDEEEEVDEDDEDEEYFDAPSTPKKGGPPMAGMGPKQSPKKMMAMMRGGGGGGQTLPRMVAGTRNGEINNNTLGKSARGPQQLVPKKQQQKQQQRPTTAEIEELFDEIEVPTEWRDLSDIERRAKEQERELQMELMRNRRERLGAANMAPASSSSVAGGGPRSRPNSASSSNSSVLSGNNPHHHHPSLPHHPHPSHHLASSKSVDFRSSSGHIADHSSVASSSRSNEGSLADLSDGLSQPPNSRLPLPRRPTIPGKTGIPLPAPSSSSSKKLAKMTLPPPTSSPASHDGHQMLDDEECF